MNSTMYFISAIILAIDIPIILMFLMRRKHE